MRTSAGAAAEPGLEGKRARAGACAFVMMRRVSRTPWMFRALLLALVAMVGLAVAVLPPAGAQAPGGGWETTDPQKGEPPGNTTVVPRAPGSEKTGGRAHIAVSAYLTETSPAIAQGLVWRVFRDAGAKATPVATLREASPTLKLDPGTYYINVAYGRANLTRKLTVAADQTGKEKFVLNAGGLRLVPVLAGIEQANPKLVSYDVESDERDEYGQRTKVVSGVKAGVVVRLNAGLYSIVSTYGDANAVARADVTVEAGKLSEVTLLHPAAIVSFKLVKQQGGDAIADTVWSVLDAQGATVKESSGALPTHFLAPGSYAVRATHSGRVFRQDFTVKAGQNALVEVVMP